MLSYQTHPINKWLDLLLPQASDSLSSSSSSPPLGAMVTVGEGRAAGGDEGSSKPPRTRNLPSGVRSPGATLGPGSTGAGEACGSPTGRFWMFCRSRDFSFF